MRTTHADRDLTIHREKMRHLVATPEARRKFVSILKDPQYAADIAYMILAGHYGLGAFIAAERDILEAGPKANVVARMGIMIAGLECDLPNHAARRAWKTLSEKEQNAVTIALKRIIKAYPTD